jgi:type II secretory pathway component PulL
LSSHPDDASDALLQPQRQAPQPVSVGWALRRTALWLLMLFVMVAVGAWLFYASIDPDEAAAGPATAQEAVQTPR